MSLHFLIDGYNVIKQLDSLKFMRTLKDSRLSLIKIVQAKRLLKAKNNQVTIIFDGKQDFYLDEWANREKGRIKIVFSKGESADEVLKRMVNNSGYPKRIVVVTNDRAIVLFVRSLGAKTMSVDEFFRTKRAQKQKEAAKIELTYQQQEQINKELRTLWQ